MLLCLHVTISDAILMSQLNYRGLVWQSDQAIEEYWEEHCVIKLTRLSDIKIPEEGNQHALCLGHIPTLDHQDMDFA